MNPNSKLFSPLTLGRPGEGGLTLNHRVIMAPLTRTRANKETFAPEPRNAEYYAQRSNPGSLVISEGVSISTETLYSYAPGIYTPEQIEGWKAVTAAVHAKGGYISAQLWHVGRVAQPDDAEFPLLRKLRAEQGAAFLAPCVSASDVAIRGKRVQYGQKPTKEKRVPFSPPRPLETAEIARLVSNYVQAAKNAKEAGFDMVEIHAAHGYLINQFLHDSTNKRTDRYGGSVENRARLLMEVVDGVCTVFPSSRVAVRLSPIGNKGNTTSFYGCVDSNPVALYDYVIARLDSKNLGYLLLSEPRWAGGSILAKDGTSLPLHNDYKKIYSNVLIGAGGFTPLHAQETVDSGTNYDAVGFGRWFIANPDLKDRLLANAPLNRYDRNTFYTYDDHGYIDYPFANQVNAETKTQQIPIDEISTSLAKL